MFIKVSDYSYINTDCIVNLHLKSGADGNIAICAKTVNNEEFEIKHYLRYQQEDALRDLENVCRELGYNSLGFL